MLPFQREARPRRESVHRGPPAAVEAQGPRSPQKSCLTTGERLQSAARDLTRTTPQDFIASPLHCVVRREASTPPAARWTLPRLRHSRITGHHRKKETVLKSHQALARSTTRLIDKLPAVGNTPNKPRASAAPPANNFLAVFVMSRSELTNARKQHTPITQTTICSKFIDRSLLRSCTPQFIDGRTRAISGSRPWTFHLDRFYRESAALRCSADKAKRDRKSAAR